MSKLRRPIGDSGLAVTPLALGGNVFGWTADEAASFRILDRFVDLGGVMIDTADVYSAWVSGHSGGESETVIGQWLRRDPAKRDKVVIATKVGYSDGRVVDGQYVPRLARSVIEQGCEGSLRRLGIDCIDLYYQHKDDSETPLAESLGVFDALRRSGKIRAVGLSNFTAGRVVEALETAEREGFAPAVALQDEYNLTARDTFEGPLQQVAIERGLSQFPYFSLASGFLTGKYRSPADLGKSVRGSRVADLVESARGRRILAALDSVAEETGATPAVVALAWAKEQPGITAPIASATRVAQLEEIMQALTLTLSAEQMERLTKASD